MRTDGFQFFGRKSGDKPAAGSKGQRDVARVPILIDTLADQLLAFAGDAGEIGNRNDAEAEGAAVFGDQRDDGTLQIRENPELADLHLAVKRLRHFIISSQTSISNLPNAGSSAISPSSNSPRSSSITLSLSVYARDLPTPSDSRIVGSVIDTFIATA